MSDLNEPNTSPEHLLAEVVASHFINARVAEEDGDQVVVLGEGLPTIECHINSMQEVLPHGTFIMLIIRGGALGPHGATVTASGYGENMHHALVAAGCNWACAFGPVLLTGIGRADLINTQDPDVEQFEATVGGRRYLVTMSRLDRGLGAGIGSDELAACRRQIGGSQALTRAVLASGTLPASRSGDVIPLGCFLGIGPTISSEVKYGLGDWAPACAVWDNLPTQASGYRMLREWAILAPVEPAPPLTRYGLDLKHFEDGWLHLAAAGCGASWLLNLGDGSVWLDSRACDDDVKQVAPGFASWYEAWLDNAIRGGGPFAQWEYRVDAAYQMLVQAARHYDDVENLLGSDFRVNIKGPDGTTVGPCHACEALYDQCGVPSTVFNPSK